MNSFLKVLAGGSLLGAFLAITFAVFIAQKPGGGPYVGGAIVFMAMVVAGLAAVLTLVGLVASLVLRSRGEAQFLRIYAGYLIVLTVIVSAWALLKKIEKENQSRQAREFQRQRLERERADEALMADSAKFSEYVAQRDVNAELDFESSSWLKPLDVAARYGYVDLAKQLLARGAVVTNQALFEAAQRGDAAMVALLVAQPARKSDAGRSALQEAFRQGRQDILRLLVEGGVADDGFTESSITQYVHFCPGDVAWKIVLERWNTPGLPQTFRDAIEAITKEEKFALPQLTEKQVLAVLNHLVNLDALGDNPVNPNEAGKSPAYGGGKTEARWEYLRDLHPKGAIGSLHEGKAFGCLVFLTRSVTDKSSTAGLKILLAAVRSGDVELTDALVQQGYSLKQLEKTMPFPSELRSPDFQSMNAYLQRHGVRIPETNGQ